MGALAFLSCAPEDGAHRDVLEKHVAPLVRDRRLHLWHEGKLTAGEERDEAVAARLEAAALVLLLISADYLASERCHAQMMRALELARTGRGRVVPILLRPCLAHRDALGGLAMLPTDSRPVTTWTSSDDAWANVAKGIAAALESTASARPSHEPGPASIPAPSPSSPSRALSGRMRKPLDDDTILRLARLEDARVRKLRLEEAGADPREVDQEILALKRQLREGGQVRQGDLLGGRYSLLQHIGRGGFATVWEAEDRKEHTRVAIKVLHTNLADDPDRIDRFLRGARVMAALTHPAVVRVLDTHMEDGGYCCIAMELVPGGDLQKAVVEGRLRRERVIPLLVGVGEALVAAHGRGYIHRDVKPANILLDADGTAKLTDFDLVGDEDTSGGTRTGAMGTFVYAAPEVLSRPQDATARADVFGLGMTALFCLHGRKLPDTVFRNPERVISAIGDRRIGDVLRKAIEWDPEDRFPTMQAFCDALRAAHASQRSSARPPDAADGAGSPAAGAGPPVHRRLYGRALIVFSCLIALFGALRAGGLLRYPGASGHPLSCPEGMVLVQSGTFLMGTPEKVKDADELEHEVTLSAYCIDRTEVTVAAYRECSKREQNGVKCPEQVPTTIKWCGHGNNVQMWDAWCNGGAGDREDHPINCVDWTMADTYCRWAGKGLPTEAQWEYAARGPDGRRYAWGDDPPGPGWLNACGLECRDMVTKAGTQGWDMLYEERDGWATTAPVGQVERDRSAFGVLDMGGNVAEWLADWYAPYDASMSRDPVQAVKPDKDPERVQRGLGWMSSVPRNARASYRWAEPEESRCVNVGFRCASMNGPAPRR